MCEITNRAEVEADVVALFRRNHETKNREEMLALIRGIYSERPQVAWAVSKVKRLLEANAAFKASRS